jgi:hypothetical protein
MSKRVAIITSVHANVPALEAVASRIDARGVDDVYCGSDLPGYGPRKAGLGLTFVEVRPAEMVERGPVPCTPRNERPIPSEPPTTYRSRS